MKENNNIDGEVLVTDEEIERTEAPAGEGVTEDKDPTLNSEESPESESQDNETDSEEEMFDIEDAADVADHEIEDQEDQEEQEEKEMSDEQAEASVEEVDEDKKDSDQEEDDFPEINLDEIEAVEHPTKSAIGSSGEASDLRIINTHKSGNRVVAKEKVIEMLDLEDAVQLGFTKDKKTIVMCKNGIGNEGYFLKKQNKTYSIYNKALVIDITEALGLDFSNASTVNLDVKYTQKNGKTYLMARK